MKKFFVVLGAFLMFASTQVYAESKAVFRCNLCEGQGKVQVTKKIRCTTCYGRRIRCYGARVYGICFECNNTGYKSCPNNDCFEGIVTLYGTKDCPQCKGKGKFTL